MKIDLEITGARCRKAVYTTGEAKRVDGPACNEGSRLCSKLAPTTKWKRVRTKPHAAAIIAMFRVVNWLTPCTAGPRVWEESGFEPLVPLATEMLIESARGITNATRMLAVGDIGLVPRLC